MRRLALFVVHRRWVVIVLAVLFLPFAALVGGGVAKQLTVGGMEDPGSESARTAADAAAAVQQGRPVGLRRAGHGPRRQRRRRRRPRRRARAHEAARRPSPASSTASSYWVGNLGPAQERGRHAGARVRLGEGRASTRRSSSRRSSRRSTRPRPTVITTAVTGPGRDRRGRSASRPSTTSSAPSCSPRRSSSSR